jgi:hypothetical protein
MRYRCRSILYAAVVWIAAWLLIADDALSAGGGGAVLLSSTAPDYVPGTVIASNERLSIPEGATATVLFQSGEMLRLWGPFDGPLNSTDTHNGTAGSIASLAETLRLQGVDAVVVGGTRSFGRLSRLRDGDTELVIDPGHAATYCISRTTSLWIGRLDGAGDRIKLRRRGTSREISWPPDAARIEWPSDVLVEDGDRFKIIDADGIT